MKGPIYFGGLTVSGSCEENVFATNQETLKKELMDSWSQEVKNVLKFINDSNMDMPLMKQVLSSFQATVTIQEYQEKMSA